MGLNKAEETTIFNLLELSTKIGGLKAENERLKDENSFLRESLRAALKGDDDGR